MSRIRACVSDSSTLGTTTICRSPDMMPAAQEGKEDVFDVFGPHVRTDGGGRGGKLALVVPTLLMMTVLSICMCVYMCVRPRRIWGGWVDKALFHCLLWGPAAVGRQMDHQSPLPGEQTWTDIYSICLPTHATGICICKYARAGRGKGGGTHSPFPKKGGPAPREGRRCPERDVAAPRGTSLPRAPARSGRDVDDGPITLGPHNCPSSRGTGRPRVSYFLGKPVARGPARACLFARRSWRVGGCRVSLLQDPSVARLARVPLPIDSVVKSCGRQREMCNQNLIFYTFLLLFSSSVSVPWMNAVCV